MRCRAIIDLDALRANYTHLEELTRRSAAIQCVVKADAYGHGSLAVARVLSEAGARHFAVASLDEAIVLRDSGIGASILVLGGLEPGTEREAALRGIDPLIGTIGELRDWNDTARSMGRKLSCHLLFNTGMNRLGIDFDPARAAGRDELLDALEGCEWVDLRGVATHYASAEDFRTRQTEGQNRVFAKQVDVLRGAGLAPRYIHAANSAAILYRGIGGPSDRVGHTMVRPGLALYGYVKAPSGRTKTVRHQLRPVLEWRAMLRRIREVPAGTPIGYGARYVAPRAMRIGILVVGYGDGLDWRLSNRGSVQIRGVPCPIIGEISMDLTIIDLNPANEAREGDEAVLLGAGANDAQGMAALTGGTPYEVLCGISKRVPREYFETFTGR